MDSSLDPAAEGQASLIALESLVPNASMKAICLNHRAWPCMQELMDYLHIVVVDRQYNAWFSGFTLISDLPSMAVLSTFGAGRVEYLVEYLRQETGPDPIPISGEACSWREAHEMIRLHFGPEGRNLGFYSTIDESGVNVCG